MNPERTPRLLEAYNSSIEQQALTYEMNNELTKAYDVIEDVMENNAVDQLPISANTRWLLKYKVLERISKKSSDGIDTVLTNNVEFSQSKQYEEYQHNPEIDGPTVKSSILKYRFSNSFNGRNSSTIIYKLETLVNGNKPDPNELVGIWFAKDDADRVRAFVIEKTPENSSKTKMVEQIRRPGADEPDFVREEAVFTPSHEARELTEAEYAEFVTELSLAATKLTTHD